jgi:DNA-binding HxlR family transcriptional regulator
MLSTVMGLREEKAATGSLVRASLRRSRAMLSAILGNRWSLLVLDEACRGTTRFNQFQERLGVAPKSLSRSLNALVGLGMLRRRAYSDSPPRFEYLLTEEGENVRPALASLSAWGEYHLADKSPTNGSLA